MVRVLVCMVGPCVEAVVQPRLRMDLLQDMAGSTAAAAARALDHRRQKAQNLPWSKNVETFTKLNLTDFFSIPFSSRVWWSSAFGQLQIYKCADFRFLHREREFQLYCWSRCDWTFLPFLSSTWRLEHTGEAWATLLSDDDAVANEAARPTEGINKIWRLKKAEQRPKERDEKGIWYFTVHLRKIEMTLFLQFHVLSMSDVLPVWAETRLRAALKTNIRSHIWLYIYIQYVHIHTYK